MQCILHSTIKNGHIPPSLQTFQGLPNPLPRCARPCRDWFSLLPDCVPHHSPRCSLAWLYHIQRGCSHLGTMLLPLHWAAILGPICGSRAPSCYSGLVCHSGSKVALLASSHPCDALTHCIVLPCKPLVVSEIIVTESGKDILQPGILANA